MIYYLCHYSCEDIEHEHRLCAPAAQNKATYIINSLADIYKDDIEVDSPSVTELHRIVKGSVTHIKENVKLRTFISFNSSYKIIRILGYMITAISVFFHLLFNVNHNDKLIVYHSLSLMRTTRWLKRIKKCEVILEVEEIYSDVTSNQAKRKKEIAFLSIADKYLIITNLLNKVVNKRQKPYAISHGSYDSVIDYKEKKRDESIHVVYAGTFDSRKGGALAAIGAVEYLPDNYHLHILGFGNRENTKKVTSAIEKVSQVSAAAISYEGQLHGEEYLRFLQRCDIGLSTQNPSAAFNATSFPSKILSYMANGLRVVSIRISAIETSGIGGYMYYYDNQTPLEIAQAIMTIDMSDTYDGRKIVEELDKKFKADLGIILEK